MLSMPELILTSETMGREGIFSIVTLMYNMLQIQDLSCA